LENPFLSGVQVQSEHCQIKELNINKLDEYISGLIVKYPDVKVAMRVFFSDHFRRKRRATSTIVEWQRAASLYEAFLMDTFLRSKNSKAVMRTNLLVGMFMYHTDVSETAWRLLQRLRIVLSRDSIEKFLKSHPPNLPPAKNFKYVIFDNLDIWLHIKNVRLNNQFKMLHLVTCIILDVSHTIEVFLDQIFLPYNNSESKTFTQFLLPDWSTFVTAANQSVNIITNAIPFGGLKFTLKEQNSCIENTKIEVLKPLIL
jgi:hypothetical protein